MAVRNDDPTRTAGDTTADDPALDRTLLSPASGKVDREGDAATGAPTALAGAQLGRYVLGEQLGAGGMGVVYQARDPELDRQLAVKIVLPQATGPRAQERLLAEAKAMAKLRHPNVVPVFDVGTTSRGVYVVMPLVGGGTLHDWLQARRRTWREVVEKFVAAGNGLAAAHAAGLVHRDFKPRNVLVGDAGEVMVADFGLAAETVPPVEPTDAAATSQVSSVAGTPAYMAPEQARGEAVTAQADQYSFCISFWEGLHGERPHDAETRTRGALPSLPASRAVPEVPPERRGAPGWLLAALARGFAPSTERRWPSMKALLAHIDARLRRPRRVLFGATVLGAIGLTTVAFATAREDGPPPCTDGAARLASAWGPTIREQVVQAASFSKLPFAKDALERILPALDRYATDWRTMHLEACRATQERRTQSPDLLDRRMVCLDRRRAALEALSTRLARSPDDVLERAADAVVELPSVQDCEDAERLLAATPLPSAPDARAAIHQVEVALDGIEADRYARNPVGLLERADDALARARTLAYPPLLARALWVKALAEAANHKNSAETLRELARVAAEARDDLMVARAWSALLRALTNNVKQLEEASALEPVAEAALLRAGPTASRFDFLEASAARASFAQQYDLAVARLREAVAISDTPAKRASALANLASVLLPKEGHKAALPVAEEALAAREQQYGPNHPITADALQTVSQILAQAGDFEGAESRARRALQIRLDVYGPDAVPVARTRVTLANISRQLGRIGDARELFKAAADTFEREGDLVQLAFALNGLAKGTFELEGMAAARPLFVRNLELLEKTRGRDSIQYAQGESDFGAKLREQGDCTAARPYLEHSMEVFARLRPEFRTFSMFHLAHCELKSGNIDRGIAILAEGDEICRTSACPGTLGAGLRGDHGRALVNYRRDRSRGLALMREARDSYMKMGMTKNAAELEDWMKQHAR